MPSGKICPPFLPDFIAVVSINFETGDVSLRVLRDTYVPMSVTGAKDKSTIHIIMAIPSAPVGSPPERDAVHP